MNKQQLVSKIQAVQATEKRRGTVTIGGGLYALVVGDSVSFLAKYSMGGATRSVGLGSFDDVSLAQAQAAAGDARALARSGVDPKQAKAARIEAANAAATAATASTMTFAKCVDGFVAEGRLQHLKSDKARDEVIASLQRAAKSFGDKPVGEITALDVKPLILAQWDRRTSAINLVKRMAAVFLWATVNGHRDITKANPADLTVIKAMMPTAKAPAKVARPMVPVAEMPALMAKLRVIEGLPARALELLILTACRRSEILFLQNGEVDFAKREINIGGPRMKMGLPHTQPMSGRVEQILRSLIKPMPVPTGKKEDDEAALADWRKALVFQGQSVGQPIAVTRVNKLLAELAPGATVHGSARASFRTWADETKRDAAAAELCLAHTSHRTAYNRAEFMSQRVKLMADWAQYCGSALAESRRHLSLVA